MCAESSGLKQFTWAGQPIISCRYCGLDFCSEIVEKENGGDSSPVPQEGLTMLANTIYSTEQLAQRRCDARLAVYEEILGRPCRNVLEVGCGPGVFYQPYTARKIAWTGIDINPFWVQFGADHNIPISNYTTEKLKTTFDVVTAFQTLEHVADPLSFMTQLVGALNPGGILHLELPNQDSFTALIRRLSPVLSKDYGFIQPPMHMRAYRRQTLSKLFTMFDLVEYKVGSFPNNHNVWGQVRNWPLIRRLFYKLTGWLGMGSLIGGLAYKR